MKSLLLVLLIFDHAANANNYYFSASGNDTNNGTSPSTPWQTISKFNAVFVSKAPEDNFLFNRGDTFYGRLIISRSGASGLPITIGAFGTGAKPIITGFTTVSAWTNLGGNIWESTSAVSSLSTCNMVSINGVNTAMGRTPNYPNYYTWNSHSDNTSISTGLSGTPDWTGAELAIFTTSYINARHPITAQSGGTISFTSSGDLWQNAPGFFFQQFHIQDDIRTLDTLNEWYYNPSTKKLDVYNTVMPTEVQVATVDTLIWTSNKSYITIRDLALRGANKDAISIAAGTDIKIINCDITYVGGTAIYGNTKVIETGLRIDSNIISQVNNCGIDLKLRYTPDTIRYNTVKNINMLIGMQNVNHTIFGSVMGISNESDNGTTSYNNVDSTGYIGIHYLGSNAVVDHNFVTNTCFGNGIRDGGAIYTWNGINRVITGTMKIFNNIVLNTGLFSEAIYCDLGTNNAEIYNNTSYNSLRGIYLGESHDINVNNNTTFANGIGGGPGAEFFTASLSGAKTYNITVKNNKFIAKEAAAKVSWDLMIDSVQMAYQFISDSNYWARPIDDNLTFFTNFAGTNTQRTLAGWQVLNGQDAHSKQSPRTIRDTSDFNFQYNATSSPVTISLPYNYLDVTGEIYNGSVTLPAYSSWVGIKSPDK